MYDDAVSRKTQRSRLTPCSALGTHPHPEILLAAAHGAGQAPGRLPDAHRRAALPGPRAPLPGDRPGLHCTIPDEAVADLEKP